jgi:hypothetical protein
MPATSAWSGAKAPINALVEILVGDSFRTNSENVFYGAGLGVRAAYVMGNSFVGLHWHEHLTNTKSEEKTDPFLGRVSLHAEGRSAYYTLEIGSDVPLNADFNFRIVTGIGALRSSGTATVRSLEGSFAPQTADRTQWAVVIDPAVGLVSRWLGRSWHTGAQLGPMIVLYDGIAIGSVNLYAYLGHVI